MAEGSLLGRTEELARIEAVVGGLDAGPAALLLVGEAGIGKSSIWSEAVAGARASGARTVLAARAVEAERDLADVVLADLLTPVAADVLPALPSPQAEGLAAALLLERPATPVAPRVVGAATFGVLQRLAAGGTVLVAIDDVQWVDPASGEALGFALRRAWDRGSRVGLLATMRGGPDVPPPAWLRALPGELERVVVGPVSLGVLHHLIRERVGITPTRAQLVRLEGASLGNPLLAIELARAIERQGRWPAPVEPLPVPGDIDRLVRDRLDDLSPDDRRVLFVVAVATDPAPDLIAAALDATGVEAVVAALDRGIEIGLLAPSGGLVGASSPWRFAHPLYAAAAGVAIPDAERRAIHARLAGLVADEEDRGRHARLSSDGPDAQTAARIETAALAARRRGAPSVAADLADAAAARTPPSDTHDAARRRILAARWLGEAGSIGRARAMLDEAIATMQPGDQRAEALELAAQMAGWVEGSGQLLALATAALDDARDPDLRARLLLRIGGQADVIGVVAALERIDEAIDLLRASDAATRDPDLLACALLQSATTRYQLGSADDEAMVTEARALLADEPQAHADGIARTESLRAHELAWIWAADHDRFAEALPRLEAELERAARIGHDRPRAIAEAEAAQLRVWMGDLDGADEHARASSEAAELAEHPQALSAALSAVAMVALSRGDLDAAEAAARAGLAAFDDDGFLRERHLVTLGSIALVRGDAASARDLLGTVLDEQLARDGRESLSSRLSADLVEAAIASDDLERAVMVLAMQERIVLTTPRPWIRVAALRGRALLAAANGDLADADVLASAAVDVAATLPMPIEQARTRLIAGRIARRRKDRRRAGELLDGAATTFAEVGAAAWLAIAQAEIARLGRRTSADPDALTETEAQVARLAAAGRTNREVGEAVFLTPKSVEGVLSRVYQKLGIRSRAELGARFAGASSSSDRESPVSTQD